MCEGPPPGCTRESEADHVDMTHESCRISSTEMDPDDEGGLVKKRGVLRWDKRKKKFIKDFDGNPLDKRGEASKRKITESGRKVDKGYKTGLYEKWKDRSKAIVQREGLATAARRNPLPLLSSGRFVALLSRALARAHTSSLKGGVLKEIGDIWWQAKTRTRRRTSRFPTIAAADTGTTRARQTSTLTGGESRAS